MATNKYTRPVLISNIKTLSTKSFSSYTAFVDAFSPRAGQGSAKMKALIYNVASVKTRKHLNFASTVVASLLNDVHISTSEKRKIVLKYLTR